MSDTTINVEGVASGVEVRTAAEVPAANQIADRTLRYDGLNFKQTLDKDSVPAVGQPPVSESITIGVTPHTIDLTAAVLARDSNLTVDLTGAKLIGFIFKAPTTNQAAVTFGPTASDGYSLFGGTNEIDVQPGDNDMVFTLKVGSFKPAVSATVKGLEVSGTDGDKFEYILYFDNS